MRRVTSAAAGMVLAAALWGVVPLAAEAAPSCQQYDSHGICVVQVETPGSGGGGSSGEPASTGGGTPASCTSTVTGEGVPCQSDSGFWVQSKQCYVQLAFQQPPVDSPIWGGHTDGAIYFCNPYLGDRSFPGTGGYQFWAATPPAGPPAVDPAVLARQALDTLVIPAPTTGRYPSGVLQDGRAFTVVRAFTWFWTDPANFQPLTARADAGGVWAQVVVTPTALEFSPGDGAAPVSCAGPGTSWQESDGVWTPSPSGCDYRYSHSSLHEPDGEVTATYTIHWTVAWTSSTGQNGTLTALDTTTNSTFAVAEAQAVVTR